MALLAGGEEAKPPISQRHVAGERRGIAKVVTTSSAGAALPSPAKMSGRLRRGEGGAATKFAELSTFGVGPDLAGGVPARSLGGDIRVQMQRREGVVGVGLGHLAAVVTVVVHGGRKDQ